MKYFTPDLLLRYGSEDDATADAAHREWERKSRQYQERLDAVRPLLPRAARSLLRRYCLHDARVLMLGIPRDDLALSLVLELDDATGTAVQLVYDLVRKPRLRKHPELAERGAPLEWLYDEFDVEEGKEGKVFTHSILFTGGQELRLAFRKLSLLPFRKVVVQDRERDESDLDSLYEAIGA
jgi:hypothetical protein